MGGAAFAALLIIAAGFALLQARAIDFEELSRRLHLIGVEQQQQDAQPESAPDESER